MKSYNIDEIIDICNNQGYGFVCLTDGKGAELIPYNSRNSANERLDEIKTRLTSPALKDGVYYVKCKHTNRKNALSDDYLVYKGEKLSENIVVNTQPISAEVLTYESALKFQVRIKELELENQNLKSNLSNCEKTIQELQSELETVYLSEDNDDDDDDDTPKTTMFESAKEFLSEIVQVAAPLLDKHFDLKQQALNLEAHKILRGQQKQAQPTAPKVDESEE